MQIRRNYLVATTAHFFFSNLDFSYIWFVCCSPYSLPTTFWTFWKTELDHIISDFSEPFLWFHDSVTLLLSLISVPSHLTYLIVQLNWFVFFDIFCQQTNTKGKAGKSVTSDPATSFSLQSQTSCNTPWLRWSNALYTSGSYLVFHGIQWNLLINLWRFFFQMQLLVLLFSIPTTFSLLSLPRKPRSNDPPLYGDPPYTCDSILGSSLCKELQNVNTNLPN